MLVLDDLHWASTPTVLLLAHLLRSPAPMNLLVLAIYRDTDLGRGHPLAGPVADLRREPGVERLALAGLAVEGVAALVRARTRDGDPVDAGLARVLHEQTQGNPFYLGEILAHLAEAATAADADLPEGITAVIDRRLSRLSPACAQLLGVASVVGSEFPVQVLEPLLSPRLTDDEILDALDEATHAGLLVEAGSSPGCYQFGHALVRRTLYTGLSTARRVRFHRLVGDALTALPTRWRPAAVLAHHFTEAAPEGTASLAVRYAIEAADEAIGQLAFEEALAVADRALGVVDLEVDLEPALRCELWLVVAEARARLLDVAGARDAALAAANAARATDEVSLPARAALAAIRACQASRITIEAPVVALAESALDHLGADHPVLRAQLLAELAFYRALPDSAAIEADARKALALARDAGDDRAVLTALSAICLVLDSSSRTDEYLAACEELVDAAEAAGDHLQAAYGYFWRCTARLMVGDRPGAERDLGRLEAVSAAARSPFGALRATWIAGCLALIDGRFADAEELIDRVLASSGGNEAWVQVWGAQMFILGLERGTLGDLEPVLADLVAHGEVLPVFRAVLAMVHAELGALDEARALFDALAPDRFSVLQVDNARAISIVPLSELATRLDDAARAATLLDLYGDYAGTIMCVAGCLCLGAADRYLAMLRTTLGRFEEAEDSFLRALDLEGRLGSPTLLARTRYWYARMLARRGVGGDAAAAADLLDEVLATTESLGMAALSAQATSLRAEVA